MHTDPVIARLEARYTGRELAARVAKVHRLRKEADRRARAARRLKGASLRNT